MRKPIFSKLPVINDLVYRCEGIPFRPVRQMRFSPKDVNIPFEDVYIHTLDKETIHGWYIPGAVTPDNDGESKTVLFFRGNRGNISHQLQTIPIFHELGVSMLLIDYRGYGKSTGRPSINGTVIDGLSAWSWLIQHKKLTPERIVIVGRSMGGGLASAVASRTSPAGLILESAYNSNYQLLRPKYPSFFAIKLVIRHDYDVKKDFEKLQCPLLVIHSPKDEEIPFAYGNDLYASYAGPKSMLSINGTHATGFLQSKSIYVKGLKDFFSTLS